MQQKQTRKRVGRMSHVKSTEDELFEKNQRIGIAAIFFLCIMAAILIFLDALQQVGAFK